MKKITEILFTRSIPLIAWFAVLLCLSLSGDALAEEDVSTQDLTPVETVAETVTNEMSVAVASVSEAIENLPIIVMEETPIEEVVEEAPKEPVIPHTEADVYLLAQLIHSEAGIESPQCKQYVGSVVLNRMSCPEFPNTLSGVVFDRKYGVQFSVTIRGRNGKRPIDNTPSAEEIEISRSLLNDGSVLPSDVLVFFSTSCDSGWVTSRKRFDRVDHTIFSYMHK